MRFTVDWIDGGVNRAAEERATLCELGIYVDSQNACRFIDYARPTKKPRLSLFLRFTLPKVWRPTGGSLSAAAAETTESGVIEPGLRSPICSSGQTA